MPEPNIIVESNASESSMQSPSAHNQTDKGAGQIVRGTSFACGQSVGMMCMCACMMDMCPPRDNI